MLYSKTILNILRDMYSENLSINSEISGKNLFREFCKKENKESWERALGEFIKLGYAEEKGLVICVTQKCIDEYFS